MAVNSRGRNNRGSSDESSNKGPIRQGPIVVEGRAKLDLWVEEKGKEEEEKISLLPSLCSCNIFSSLISALYTHCLWGMKQNKTKQKPAKFFFKSFILLKYS